MDETKVVDFKKAILSVKKEVKLSKDNFALSLNFERMRQQVAKELGINSREYFVSLFVKKEGNEDGYASPDESKTHSHELQQTISNQSEYETFITKIQIYDYETINIDLNPSQPSMNGTNKIIDQCFESEEIHESFEVTESEQVTNDVSIPNILQQIANATNSNKLYKPLTTSLTNGPDFIYNYDASEAIPEQSELSIHPSLHLSTFQSKQRTNESEILILAQQQSLSSSPHDGVSCTSSLSNQEKELLQKQLGEGQKVECISNIVNFEIVRQILNRHPKLQFEDENDYSINMHAAFYHQQKADNRRSTSPQPKTAMKQTGTDLSASQVMKSYKCNNCKKPIEKVRFHCLVCYNTDHCEGCQRDKRADHNHPFMKYKNVPVGKSLTKSQILQHPQLPNQQPNYMNQGGIQGNNLNEMGMQTMSGTFNMTTIAAKPPNLALNPSYLNQSSINRLSNQSTLTQTLPPTRSSVPMPTQQNSFQQQPQMIFNSLQSSQNLNIPFSYSQLQGGHAENINIGYQKANQGFIPNNVSPNSIQAQQKLKNVVNKVVNSNVQVHQDIPNNNDNNYIYNNRNINNNSVSQSSNIIVRDMSNSKLLAIQVERNQPFKVCFIVKNGGKFPFPEGGFLKSIDLWVSLQKEIKPLKPNEQQDIEFELVAPNVQNQQFYYFKSEFPLDSDKSTFEEKGSRFWFQLDVR